VLGLPIGGAAVSRFGSRCSLRLAFVFYPTMLAPMAVVPSLACMSGLLVVWAMANSVIDVAMNAAGLELEQLLRRPTLSRLHAAQSVGLLVGGLAATIAAGSGIPLLLPFGLMAVVGVLAAAVATTCLPAGAFGARSALLRLPERRLLRLAFVAFCAFLIVGGASNWAAVDLRTEQHASAAVATAGCTLFTAAMVLTRMGGDWAFICPSRSRLAQESAITAAGGARLVVCAHDPTLAMFGWLVTGVGLATLRPPCSALPLHTPRTLHRRL
jgi:hypothetical protein